MQAEPKPRRPLDADRLHLTAAIALAAGAIAAGIALGHHSAQAQSAPAAEPAATATATVAWPAERADDRSLPDAAGVLRDAPHEPAEPPASF